MVTTKQAEQRKTLYHVISLHEEAEKVFIRGIRLVHNVERFYIDYSTTKNGKILTDVNTSFETVKPTLYA